MTKSAGAGSRDEIARPLGADFQIGALPGDADRIAKIVPSTEPLALPMDQLTEVMLKTFAGPPPDPNLANTAAWRAADVGAANGHGNARSLARVLSPISLGGTVNGVEVLRTETVEKIFTVQSDGPDEVLLGHPVRWGLGFALPQRESFPYIPDEKICFWGGWGGSWETMNPDRRATIAYVMNKMAPDVEGSPRTERYFTSFYEALARWPVDDRWSSTSRPSARRSCRGVAPISVTPSATPARPMSEINPANPATVPA